MFASFVSASFPFPQSLRRHKPLGLKADDYSIANETTNYGIRL